MKFSRGLLCALFLTLLLPLIVSGRRAGCRTCSCQIANSKAADAEKKLTQANHAIGKLEQKNIGLGDDFAIRVSTHDGFLVGYIHDEFSPKMTLPPNSQMKIVPRSNHRVDEPVVRLYFDNNHKGLFTDLPIPGNYTASQISLPRNSVSSLQIPPGFQAIMYTQDGFNGDHVVVSGSVSNLDKFNDRMQSIEITKNFVKDPEHLAVIYSHPGYAGKQQGLMKGSNYSIKASDIKSISIQNGYNVLIYTPDTMTLLDIIQSSSSSIISNPMWHHDTTRLHGVVQDASSPSCSKPYAILHTDIEFKGGHFIVEGGHANLDGTLSSIQIPAEYEAVLYDQPNQQGNYVVVSGEINNLIFYAFNDRAKSIALRSYTPQEHAVIYTNPNYTGEKMTLPIGHSECSSSQLLNFCQNVYASSIKVPPGFKATLTKAPTPITRSDRIYTYLEDTPNIRNYVDTLLVSVLVEKI
jgi:hypothetical protein